MYSYRKRIQVSQGVAPISAAVIDTLNLSGFGVNKIADVELKVTLFDPINDKASIYYYRNVQIVDPAAGPIYFNQNNSTFDYAEDNVNAVYLLNVVYSQGTSNLSIEAFNPTSGAVNTLCVVDYKINFY